MLLSSLIALLNYNSLAQFLSVEEKVSVEKNLVTGPIGSSFAFTVHSFSFADSRFSVMCFSYVHETASLDRRV